MSSNIKGLNIEIGGDTTKLGDALKGVQTKIKTTESSLRSVNQMLKFDPSNSDLLSQKQQLINKELDEQKQKLEILKTAQSQLPAEVDKTSAEYITLEQQIQMCETRIQTLQTQQNTLPASVQAAGVKFKEVGDTVSEIGEKVKGVGEDLTKKVSAPIAAAGTAAVTAFNSVDAGLDVVTQKTGASGKSLESMQTIAKNLFTSMPIEIGDAGAAVGEINTRFGLTGDSLENLSRKFLEFSELNNVDVSSSIDNVQKSLSAWGLDASHAGEILDGLNYTAQQTGVDVNTLTTGLYQYSGVFSQLGLSAGQAITFMGQLEKSGTDVNAAMAGLQKAMTNAAAEGKPLNEALDELQTNFDNAGSDTERMTMLTDLFGARAAGKMLPALKDGSLSFKDLSDSCKLAGDSVHDTYEEVEKDGKGDYTKAMNQFKVTLSDVGKVLQDTLRPIIEEATAKLKEFAKWWKNLDPGIKNFIVKAALVVAAIGPIIVVIGVIVTSIGNIIGAIGGTITIVGKLIPILAGITPQMAAIGIAIAAIILVIQNWGTISKAVGDVINNVIASIVTTFHSWQTWFDSWWVGVNTWFANAEITVWNAITGILNGVWNILSGVPGMVYSYVSGAITGAINTIGSYVEGVRSAVTNVIETVKSVIGNLYNDAVTWAQDMLQGFIDGIKSNLKGVKDAASGVANKIKSVLGFSLPEDGPLSDADTYMPDFIQLMTRGIEKNKPALLSQVDALAAEMKEGIGAVSASANSQQSINLNASFVATMDGKAVTDVVTKQVTKNVTAANAYKGR